MAFPFNGTILQQSFTYRDAKGNTSVLRFYIDGTDLTAGEVFAGVLNGHIGALSNAAFQNARGPYSIYGTAQYGAHNAGGAYESVIEKAVFVFQDAAGGLHRFTVPAPKIGIFLADKITVDPAIAGVVSFKNDVTGGMVLTRQGIALVNLMGGYYQARHLRRRMNVLVLTPPLTATEPAE